MPLQDISSCSGGGDGGSSNISITIYSAEGKGGDDLQHILISKRARALGVCNRPSFHRDSRC